MPDQTPTVLIVEDDSSLAGVIEKLLVHLGCRVLSAENGCAALEVLAKEPHPPDLVLTDLYMPRMNGLELLQQIKQSHPKLPVVLLSGTDTEALERRGAPEPDRVLKKPFNMVELRDVIVGLAKK